jgi:hypothetical protein
MSRRAQWCPRCKERCYQEDGGRVENENMYTEVLTKSGQPTGGLERYFFLHAFFERCLPNLPHMGGYYRYRKCTACGQTWQSIEVPDEFLTVMLAEVEKLQKERTALQVESDTMVAKLRQLRSLSENMQQIIEPPTTP